MTLIRISTHPFVNQRRVSTLSTPLWNSRGVSKVQISTYDFLQSNLICISFRTVRATLNMQKAWLFRGSVALPHVAYMGVLLTGLTLGFPILSLAGPTYQGDSWNIALEDNDRSSINQAIEWSQTCPTKECEKVLRFRLEAGNIGGSPTDNQVRSNASFWERAELRSGYLSNDRNFNISFRIRFLKGFVNDRETFFQIHNHDSRCGGWPPPSFMLKWSSDGKLTAASLRLDSDNLLKTRQFTPEVKNFYGQWININLRVRRFDQKRNVWELRSPQLGTYRGKYFLPPCRNPFLKFGIYRPGYRGVPNETSESELADVLLSYPKEEQP